ncbi:MAG: gyrase subunit, partial [Patescibacteria group bacterium]|nr:gyrase subunit [Patescibacteria group bacterium]
MTDQTDLKELGQIKDIHGGEIISTSIVSEMKKSYLDYAMSVIVARALPDIRDGLKPVQRRIIYAANEMGLTYTSRYRKAATLVGEVMGKYHPHGDQSIYDALVRMAQDFSLRYTLIDGQGNWGNIDGDGAAAMRYTECKMEKLTDYLLHDIDKNTVEFADNFSGEQKEPQVLPSGIPNLLMNGALGIAVGMATNIPPHNLNELIDAIMLFFDSSKVVKKELRTHTDTIYQVVETTCEIQNWELDHKITVEELYKVIKGPDFPTGCTIYDKSEILNYLSTGRGRIVQQAKADIKESKSGKFHIVITQIPYQVTKATLVEKIGNLVNEKKIKDISAIKDTSSGESIEIIIELKKEAIPQKVLNSLYKYTQLQ